MRIEAVRIVLHKFPHTNVSNVSNFPGSLKRLATLFLRSPSGAQAPVVLEHTQPPCATHGSGVRPRPSKMPWFDWHPNTDLWIYWDCCVGVISWLFMPKGLLNTQSVREAKAQLSSWNCYDRTLSAGRISLVTPTFLLTGPSTPHYPQKLNIHVWPLYYTVYLWIYVYNVNAVTIQLKSNFMCVIQYNTIHDIQTHSHFKHSVYNVFHQLRFSN